LSPSLSEYPPQTVELAQRIREAENDVERLVATEVESEDHSRSDLEGQKPRQSHYTQDAGSDDDLSDDDGADESYEALEERFHALEEEVAILVADVHDLALYTKLNITGFMKILKVRLHTPIFARTNADCRYQKHDASLFRVTFAHTDSLTETNQNRAEDNLCSRLSRETPLLQVQLGCSHC